MSFTLCHSPSVGSTLNRSAESKAGDAHVTESKATSTEGTREGAQVHVATDTAAEANRDVSAYVALTIPTLSIILCFLLHFPVFVTLCQG